MPDSIALGIPGVQIPPGNQHICAFYPSLENRDDLLLPYLRAGLEADDKCICLVDTTSADALFADLSGDAELGPRTDRQQLDIRESQDSYLRGGGFSTEAMLEFLEESVVGAIADGFGVARIAGEMTWALRRSPGVEELIEYEARLNHFLPRYPQVFLCLYELGRFSGQVLVDVLKTHPKVMLGGIVLDNPYYLEPDEFLATRR